MNIDLQTLPPQLQLKIERLARGLTQQQVAHRAGISEGALSKIETGRRSLTADATRRIRAAIEIESP